MLLVIYIFLLRKNWVQLEDQVQGLYDAALYAFPGLTHLNLHIWHYFILYADSNALAQNWMHKEHFPSENYRWIQAANFLLDQCQFRVIKIEKDFIIIWLFKWLPLCDLPNQKVQILVCKCAHFFLLPVGKNLLTLQFAKLGLSGAVAQHFKFDIKAKWSNTSPHQCLNRNVPNVSLRHIFKGMGKLFCQRSVIYSLFQSV